MTSLLTNASAMTALQTLSSTNKNLASTQGRIATGLRVAEASDNAAYWSIATGMKAQSSALSAVQDSLGFGKAILDTTYTALQEAIEKTSDMLSKYVTGGTDGIDQDAVDAELTQLKEQITSIADNANFEGQNLLKDGGTAVNVVSGYIGTAADTEKLQTLTLAAFDLAAEVDGITDLDTAQAALDAMKSQAATYGAQKMRIESQSSFTAKQIAAIDRGVGQLVDADMNAESARLSALQVQQQLGIQALSIANSSTQNILSLFR
ncbi:flagellin [Mesorhizobium sp. CAU 1732]|uniref:flagellin N-terminal helical domain-containing protein n=1 Tax=Mesorhizobium sp. CAU 1732 TaxID=3140358 RepID=UPI003261C021